MSRTLVIPLVTLLIITTGCLNLISGPNTYQCADGRWVNDRSLCSNSVQIIDCGSNITCFSNQLINCKKAKLSTGDRYETEYFEVIGREGDRCKVYVQVNTSLRESDMVCLLPYGLSLTNWMRLGSSAYEYCNGTLKDYALENEQDSSLAVKYPAEKTSATISAYAILCCATQPCNSTIMVANTSPPGIKIKAGSLKVVGNNNERLGFCPPHDLNSGEQAACQIENFGQHSGTVIIYGERVTSAPVTC